MYLSMSLEINVLIVVKSQFDHRLANKVFRSDQLQPFMLAASFIVDRIRNLRINFMEREGHGEILHSWVPKTILLWRGHSCPREAARYFVVLNFQIARNPVTIVKVIRRTTSLAYRLHRQVEQRREPGRVNWER